MKPTILWIFFLVLATNLLHGQINLFAELVGNPVVTTGWSLSGSTTINSDEVVLTPSQNNKAGRAFVSTPIDFSNGGRFIVDFEFRIYDGNKADGLAFNVLTLLPTTSVNTEGQEIGVPNNSTGLKIVFDTYNNNCSQYVSPQIQVFNGTGYYECNPTIQRIANQQYLRSPNYQSARIIYDNGTVQIFVNCELKLTASNVEIQHNGYFGFSAATGGNYDRHSIKNVKIYTNPNVIASVVSHGVCSGEEKNIGFDAIPNTTYLWESLSPTDNIALLNETNISNPLFVMTNDGDTVGLQNYLLTTTFENNGCLTTLVDTVKIEIYSKPSIDEIVTEHIEYCDPSFKGKATATVSGSNTPFLYQWQNADDNSLIGVQQHIQNLSAGNYSFTVTNSKGCVATQNLMILAPEQPILDLSASKTTICQGDTSLLGSIIIGGTTPYYLFVNDVIASVEHAVSPLQTTSYQVRVQDAKGCKDSTTVIIEVLESPMVHFAEDTIIGCTPLPLNIQNLSSGSIDSCVWIFNDHQQAETFLQQSSFDLEYILSGGECFDVTLMGYGNNGCVSKKTVQGLICPQICELHAPNVLSLHSSEGNNFWFVEKVGYDQFHCQILNRWGELIYEYHHENGRWDGRDKHGNNVHQGVYFYKITARLNEQTNIQHGTITVVD